MLPATKYTFLFIICQHEDNLPDTFVESKWIKSIRISSFEIILDLAC